MDNKPRSMKVLNEVEKVSQFLVLILGGIVIGRLFFLNDIVFSQVEATTANQFLISPLGITMTWVIIYLPVNATITHVVNKLHTIFGYEHPIPKLIDTTLVKIIVTLIVISFLTLKNIVLDFILFPFTYFNIFLAIPVFIVFIFLTLPIKTITHTNCLNHTIELFYQKTKHMISPIAVYYILMYGIFWNKLATWISESNVIVSITLLIVPIFLHQFDWVRQRSTKYSHNHITGDSILPVSSIANKQSIWAQIVLPLFLTIIVFLNYYGGAIRRYPDSINIQIYILFTLIIVSTIAFRYYSVFIYSAMIGIGLVSPWYDNTSFIFATVISLLICLGVPVGLKAWSQREVGELKEKISILLEKKILTSESIKTVLDQSNYQDITREFMHTAFVYELMTGSIDEISHDNTFTYITMEKKQRIAIEIATQLLDPTTDIDRTYYIREFRLTSSYFEQVLLPLAYTYTSKISTLDKT